MSDTYYLNIPDINFKSVPLINGGDNMLQDMQRVTNIFIQDFFPIVSELTMHSLEQELNASLNMKERTLKKLKKRYKNSKQNINIISTLTNDDYEMDIEGNVKLITDSHAYLMRSARETNLIQIILKQYEKAIEGKSIELEYTKIYTLLREYCENTFTKLEFVNQKQSVLDDVLIQRIIKVWQIFDQYFKQFDYLDYLNNYNTIKAKADTSFILSIIRILVDVGAVTRC